MKYRGVVYDVGLNFNDPPPPLSVDPWNPALAAHDIHAIAHALHANALRIEGEPIARLTAATRLAHAQGLKVFETRGSCTRTPRKHCPTSPTRRAGSRHEFLAGGDVARRR
ncbi:hypothetical protein C7974DRAFT_408171 [Boeremia exigua]|uniref:uncharacterized protein n=1 Tax=Boeremia exigua TaxID=749465 RepID=UPI001E8E7905|nr:uncharacterized protein C7974DRAFT_408171 [Boeremia exigua]KAH6644499.1 hypothetical protein C7974DRAFT_408171 [Boeremia exigua]